MRGRIEGGGYGWSKGSHATGWQNKDMWTVQLQLSKWNLWEDQPSTLSCILLYFFFTLLTTLWYFNTLNVHFLMTCLSKESVSCVRAGRDFYIFHLLMVSIAQVRFWHRKDTWYMLLLQETTGAGLEEAQAGIKISGRNINNLRYADDTNLWQKMKKN